MTRMELVTETTVFVNFSVWDYLKKAEDGILLH